MPCVVAVSAGLWHSLALTEVGFVLVLLETNGSTTFTTDTVPIFPLTCTHVHVLCALTEEGLCGQVLNLLAILALLGQKYKY